MDAAALKDKLQARLVALQAQRAELVTNTQAQLARFDAQIGAIRNLAQNWETLTIEQALEALEQAGVGLKVG